MELIDREKLQATIRNMVEIPNEVRVKVLGAVSRAKKVDAVEVVHGRWEPHPRYPGYDRCSACCNCNIGDDWADGEKWNYCPNCGAKMDGERREGE